MNLMQTFWRNQRGGAAIEMAIVMPVLAALALISAEFWMMAMDKQRAATALDAASDYYMGGGLSDDEAAGVAVEAWRDPPEGARVSHSRSGRCGTQAADVSAICTDGAAAAIYVTLSASGMARGLFEERTVEAERTVRVR